MIKNSKRIVEVVLNECLGYKKGENVLIVTDNGLEHLASIFFNVAHKMNIDVTLAKMPARKIHGEEPTRPIAEALKTADIALLITEKSLSHTKARKTACSQYGTKIASLPGLTRGMLERSILINYRQLKKKTSQLAKKLSRASSIRLTTPKGTDLTMSIGGRKGFEDNGLYIKKGSFGNLPAGEACISPVEGSTNGKLIIDASIAPIGKLHKPIEIAIQDGYAVNISSKRFSKILDTFGKPAFNIAELGIGLNPKAKVTGSTLEDEKSLNTAHIAFGNNLSFGGKTYAPCHLDGVILNPKITLT